MSKFTQHDRDVLRGRGITEEQAESQLQNLRSGFPSLRLDRPATAGDGILQLGDDDTPQLLAAHRQAADAGRLMKFVPASGAASRMFASLARARQASYSASTQELRAAATEEDAAADTVRFLESIDKFAFGTELQRVLGPGQPTPREVLVALLEDEGLGFAKLPKGLIPFHGRGPGARTAFEEHLVEAGLYASNNEGRARLHFTVPPEFDARIAEHLRLGREKLGPHSGGIEFELSHQQSSTDMLAATMDGEPVRDAAGELLFRPGGHGALLENLAGIDADVAFLKNIDNVAPAAQAAETRIHKATLCGALVSLEAEIHTKLAEWDASSPRAGEMDALEDFARENLGIDLPKLRDEGARRSRMRAILDRPLRVCGMVQNQGEPGGGPYWVRDEDGSQSLQIVEAAQIDQDDPEQAACMKRATHFNPVDLVCALRNRAGDPFELSEFVDERTGIRAKKTFEGEPIWAVERPGLWNGAMARWNTVFVEMPISTFSPVKTVLDLLRPEHQAG